MHQPEVTSSLPKCESINFYSKGTTRVIELDRPTALHALNMEMIEAMLSALKTWQDSSNCSMVILKSDNTKTKTKSFCAGGDVVALVNNKSTLEQRSEFFQKEYSLNHLIGTYSKPIISILDGITSMVGLCFLYLLVGGGAGISIHGPFRIATENTIFAMPETAIGFFPDVGGSFFLSSHAGIATHFVPSTRIDDLVESLSSASTLDPSNLSAYIEQFSGELEPFSLEPLLTKINRCFSASKVTDIVQNLRVLAQEDSLSRDWVNEIIGILSKMSPISLGVTLDLLRKGKGLTFKECLSMEFNLAKNFLEKVSDLQEGINSKLVKKEKTTRWSNPSIEDVSDIQVGQLFARHTLVLNHIDFLNDRNYYKYPHEDNALPTTERVKTLIESNRNQANVGGLIEKYCHEHHEKLGLRNKLKFIIQKHVTTREQMEREGRTVVSGLIWND